MSIDQFPGARVNAVWESTDGYTNASALQSESAKRLLGIFAHQRLQIILPSSLVSGEDLGSDDQWRVERLLDNIRAPRTYRWKNMFGHSY